MAAKRALGTVVYLESTTSIALSITLTSGAVLNASDAAYQTLAAGRYALRDLILLLAAKIRTWIFAASAGDANVTSNDTAAGINMSLAIVPAVGANATLCSLTITNIDAFTPGPVPAVIASAILDNTNGLWSKLG